MTASPLDLGRLRARIGSSIGTSDWLEIEQSRVDDFARITDDFQFIHVDPERARETEFGGTIAHGFLALSLMSSMFRTALGGVIGGAMSMNYGFESIRFISPIRTGKRIRGHFMLKDCTERKPGQWKLVLATTVEIDGADKPALVADWLVAVFDTGLGEVRGHSYGDDR